MTPKGKRWLDVGGVDRKAAKQTILNRSNIVTIHQTTIGMEDIECNDYIVIYATSHHLDAVKECIKRLVVERQSKCLVDWVKGNNLDRHGRLQNL